VLPPRGDMRRHRKTGKRGSLRNVKGSPGQVLPGAALTIRSLEVFVIVARTGTMVAAAEQLKLSQPAISQMIGSLEQSLGVQLFDRAVRPPVLTLQGTALLKHAKAITESVDQFRSTVRLGGAAQLPLLRIGVLNSFATTVGPYVFKQLRNVAAEWAIDSGFQATRYRAVAERNFDFAITADEAPIPDGIVVMPLLSEPFLLIVPASYKRERVSLQNLSKDLDLIRFGRDPALHTRLDRELAQRGLIAASLPSRYNRRRAEHGCRRVWLDDPVAARCHQSTGARRRYSCVAVSWQAVSKNDQHRILEEPGAGNRSPNPGCHNRRLDESIHAAGQATSAATCSRYHHSPRTPLTQQPALKCVQRGRY
jgi:DNA-binding transcriptional LysR family regulator